MKKLLLIATGLLLLHTTIFAQPFIKEVSYFKKSDSINPPPQHPILFVGSSSFTNWKDVNSYFPSYNILNRAFGGSSLPNIIMYADDIIFKYNPKQIVIYCGENDLSSGPKVNGDTILKRFKDLHSLIRSRLKKVPVVYISMKPSPFRAKYIPVMEDANNKIKAYIKKQKKTEYIDVYHKMFTEDGKIMTDIFRSDSLHMNAKGYAIWKPLIEPYLKK